MADITLFVAEALQPINNQDWTNANFPYIGWGFTIRDQASHPSSKAWVINGGPNGDQPLLSLDKNGNLTVTSISGTWNGSIAASSLTGTTLPSNITTASIRTLNGASLSTPGIFNVGDQNDTGFVPTGQATYKSSPVKIAARQFRTQPVSDDPTSYSAVISSVMDFDPSADFITNPDNPPEAAQLISRVKGNKNVGSVYGLESGVVSFQSNGSIHNVSGVMGFFSVEGDGLGGFPNGTASPQKGVDGWTWIAGGTFLNLVGTSGWTGIVGGSVGIISGIDAIASVEGTGTITDKAISVNVQNTIDNSGGATVQNRYGIYINPFTGTAVNDFAFYSAATQPSLFSGKVTVAGILDASDGTYGVQINADGQSAIFGKYAGAQRSYIQFNTGSGYDLSLVAGTTGTSYVKLNGYGGGGAIITTGVPATTDVQSLTILQTLNGGSGVNHTAVKALITEGASGTGSGTKLLDLWYGTSGNEASKFSVDKTGMISVPNTVGIASASNPNTKLRFNGDAIEIWLNSSGPHFMTRPNFGFTMTFSQSVCWTQSNYADTATVDLILGRDAAGALAQRNGVNAQTYRVYNTYTDASNYERGTVGWSSNVLRIGTEAAGTGTVRNVAIIQGGNAAISINSTQVVIAAGFDLLFQTDNAKDIGTGNNFRPRQVNIGTLLTLGGVTFSSLPTPTAGMVTYVTDSTVSTVGSTVTGGGTNKVLAWYNGTNWKVFAV